MDRRKLTISPKVIGIIAAILIIIIGITGFLNADRVKEYDGAKLTVCIEGKEVAEYTVNQLMDIEQDTVYAAFTSGKAADEEGKWTGIWLETILAESGISDDEYKTVIFSAGDGYSAAADVDEVETVIVSWAKNGEMLEPFEDGGTGPMRCIFTEDSFGQRCIHNVIRIDCRL